MSSQQYDDLVEGLEGRYDEFTQDQIQAVAETVDQRYDQEVDPDDIYLEDGYGESVEVTVDGIDDEFPISADPTNEVCVTWGNVGDEVAPEGPAKDGNGDDIFGVR